LTDDDYKAPLLKGQPVAEAVLAEVAERVAKLAANDVTVGLGTILVGDDEASATYVRMKHEACAQVGIVSHHRHLPAGVSQDEVHAVVREFNDDPSVTAYLMQHPFPKGLDFGAALLQLDPDKDADGLHPTNLGRLANDLPCPISCTPAGIQALLMHYGIPIEGRHVVIIGRGITVGRPLSILLSQKRPNANAAVTVVHTGVRDLAAITSTADILIGGTGTRHLITPEMVKPGAAVVATGVGDSHDIGPGVRAKASWVTPRFGGVGPTTVAMLLRNTVDAAERVT
jgi:methylenetetrahydrofolate dehydrogenase (NADP+)/methenyltetrahydrofolate cyclohydrolase